MTECFDSVGDKSTSIFWIILLQFSFVCASNLSHFIISVYLTDILNYIFLTHGIGEVTGSSLFVFKLSFKIKIYNNYLNDYYGTVNSGGE